MNKFFCFATLLCMAIGAAAQPRTIYLNSKTITCDYYGKQAECLQFKTKLADTAWQVYKGNIRGFRYNPGYAYTLQIRQLENPQQWGLVKVISKTKSTIQQLPGDSIAALVKPPAALVGQWKYIRLLSADGEVKFTNEFLRFDAAELKVTGKASCNGFFGNYSVDTTKGEKAIHFQALGHTMMACENLPAENKLLKAMELVDNWTLTGDKLYLKTSNKTLLELIRTAPSISPNGGGSQ